MKLQLMAVGIEEIKGVAFAAVVFPERDAVVIQPVGLFLERRFGKGKGNMGGVFTQIAFSF